jgi:hypothetical protein
MLLLKGIVQVEIRLFSFKEKSINIKFFKIIANNKNTEII